MAREVFDDPFVVDWADRAQDAREDRFAALGIADQRLLFVAYAIRGDLIRIISARRAEPFERKVYHEENQS